MVKMNLEMSPLSPLPALLSAAAFVREIACTVYTSSLEMDKDYDYR